MRAFLVEAEGRNDSPAADRIRQHQRQSRVICSTRPMQQDLAVAGNLLEAC